MYANPEEEKAYRRLCSARYRAKNPERVQQTKRRYAQRNRERIAARRKELWLADKEGQAQRSQRWRSARVWVAMIGAAKARALRKGLQFDLDAAWATARWTGKCEVTGLQFVVSKGCPSPYSPSIDRIEPAKGYVQDNCRFVLMAVNALKGNGTHDEALRIARAFVCANTSR